MSCFPSSLEPLITQMVVNYSSTDAEDLAQEARLALLEQYPDFDASRSTLKTWASHVINRAMVKYARDNGFVKVNKNNGTLIRKMRNVAAEVGVEVLRDLVFSPANEIHVAPHILVIIRKDLELIRKYVSPVSSLWNLLYNDYSTPEATDLVPDDSVPDPLENIALEQALSRLTVQNRTILELHAEGYSLDDISKALFGEGLISVRISAQAVSQRLNRAKERVRFELEE